MGGKAAWREGGGGGGGEGGEGGREGGKEGWLVLVCGGRKWRWLFGDEAKGGEMDGGEDGLEGGREGGREGWVSPHFLMEERYFIYRGMKEKRRKKRCHFLTQNKSH